MHNTHIAILGTFGPPQVACLNSWNEAGFSVSFIHINEPPLGHYTRTIFANYLNIQPFQTKNDDTVASLLNFISSNNIKYLSILSENLAEQLGRDTRINTSCNLLTNDPDVLNRLSSKSYQASKAIDAGFNVLPTYVLTKNSLHEARNIHYPIVLRPNGPNAFRPSFKALTIHSHTDLLKFIENAFPDKWSLVGQPLVLGPNVVIHGSRGKNGVFGEFAAFRTTIKHKGLSVGLTPFEAPSETIESCKRLVENEGVIGVFHFDLIESDDGRMFFFEINARMGGTTAKVYASGLDEPLTLAKSFGLTEATGTSTKLSPSVSRIALARFFLDLIFGRLTNLDYPTNRKKAFSALFRHAFFSADEIVSLKNPRITVRYFLPRL